MIPSTIRGGPVPRVLVVESEPRRRLQLGLILHWAGFRVRLAANRPEALLAAGAANTELAAAVVSLRLAGDSMAAVVAELRQRQPGLPCCVVGGGSITEDELTALPECAPLLWMPFPPGLLALVVRDLAGWGPAEPAGPRPGLGSPRGRWRKHRGHSSRGTRAALFSPCEPPGTPPA